VRRRVVACPEIKLNRIGEELGKLEAAPVEVAGRCVA
jgi:hypothetical protein